MGAGIADITFIIGGNKDIEITKQHPIKNDLRSFIPVCSTYPAAPEIGTEPTAPKPPLIRCVIPEVNPARK
ncbi:hypothetical protein D3C76_1381760 [compost metagenome]